MKSYRELSGRYLKTQKKRTILTIVGVVLSVSLLCAAGIMGQSFKNMMEQNVRQHYGNYHAFFQNIDRAQLNKLQNNIKIKNVGFRIVAGTAEISKTQNITITAGNDAFLDIMYMKLAEGRLPEKENEIALEQWIIDNMKEKPEIGSSIRLTLKVPGKPEGQNTASREFLVTGIFGNAPVSQFTRMSVGFVTPQTAASILGIEDPKLDAAINIKDGIPKQAAIEEIAGSIGLKKEEAHQNTAVLSLDSQGGNAVINKSVMVVELIMVLVILISTVAVIYNSFHISVLERIHQFGVLRSVGTTPRQIRAIILIEACFLGIIGIPLGLFFGVLAVKCVMGIFSLQSGSFFGGLQVVIQLRTILLTAVLGFATLLVSAFGPAITAGRVSPMEAILNMGAKNRVKKRRGKHPVIMKLLRVEGVMAAENLVRNRKRFVVTVFSMSIAIVLFIFFSTFLSLMSVQINTSFEKDFAVDRPFNSEYPGFTQKDYDEIAAIPGVKNVYRILQKDQEILLTEGQVRDEYKKALGNKAVNTMVKSGDTQYYGLTSNFYGYREAELKMYRPNIVTGGIDFKKMNSENGVLAVQDVRVGNEDLAASDLKIGDKIMMVDPKDKNRTVELKIMGILDKLSMVYGDGSAKYSLITTEEVFSKISGVNDFSRFDVELASSADQAAVKSRLAEIAARVEGGNILDFVTNSMKVLKMEMSVILYGLVSVISLIGALNIINTISTNLILRIREFGTLRAVGMTPKQIKGMIRLEGVFYGLVAAFYGAIAGCLLSRLLFHYLNQIKGLTWHLPWQSAVEACLVAILIGLLASAAPLKRITHMNVVESIRAEE